MSKPSILFYDIETSLSIVGTFPMWKANIDYKCVYQDWYMICASWKWQGQKSISSASVMNDSKRFKKDVTDDYHVIKSLHDALQKADAIVGHNADKFDIKKFNARAIFHGLPPIHDVLQIDTLKMAKGKFSFSFNRLDYIAKFLGVGQKIKTDIQLWLDCMEGDEKAIKKMVRYNRMDVKVLEEVYNKLAPYCPSKLNYNLFTEDRVCAKCGSKEWTSYSKRRLTKTGSMLQLQCSGCGGYSSYPLSKTGKEGMIR